VEARCRFSPPPLILRPRKDSFFCWDCPDDTFLGSTTHLPPSRLRTRSGLMLETLGSFLHEEKRYSPLPFRSRSAEFSHRDQTFFRPIPSRPPPSFRPTKRRVSLFLFFSATRVWLFLQTGFPPSQRLLAVAFFAFVGRSSPFVSRLSPQTTFSFHDQAAAFFFPQAVRPTFFPPVLLTVSSLIGGIEMEGAFLFFPLGVS